MGATDFHLKRAFSVDVDAAIQSMAAFDLRPPKHNELLDGIAITESLLGQKIAKRSVIERLQDATRITVWVIGEPVDGFYIGLPLTLDGEESVRNGSFDPADPLPAHIAAAGEMCAGVYIGVYAARTKESRRSIMQASAMLRVQIFGSVPCFARAATEDGARSMARLGFAPVEGGLPDLYAQEALEHIQSGAA